MAQQRGRAASLRAGLVGPCGLKIPRFTISNSPAQSRGVICARALPIRPLPLVEEKRALPV
jgi:hypothetical protein